jgi:hypothetical protein
MATQHGVMMREVMQSILPINMNENFLDPFHSITTPAGNVILLNLAKTLHLRGSFQTFVNFVKGIQPERGGRIWLRVRFNAGGRLRIRNDAGEALTFSSTAPEDVLGCDYTTWCHDKLLEHCITNQVPGITMDSTDTEMKTKLNDIKAQEQGWWSGDRLLWLSILRLWHWIVRFLTYLPADFHRFQRDIRHFEPAVRTLCDVVVLCFGPKAVKTQLLVLRDVMPVLAFEALRHGDTLAIFDMRGTEDSHREHKKRANTKMLRSKDGDKSNVRMKVKREENEKVLKEEQEHVTEARGCSKGSNTPQSTNAYHRKMLSECYHTLTMREKTKNRNMWARYQNRRAPQKQSKTMVEAEVGQDAPVPVAIVDSSDLEAWKALAAEEGLFDRKINGFKCQDLNISRISTFTETSEGMEDVIFTSQAGWAAKLKAYGWRDKGGTLALLMENKRSWQIGTIERVSSTPRTSA